MRIMIWIIVSWLHQKSTDLYLHCFQKRIKMIKLKKKSYAHIAFIRPKTVIQLASTRKPWLIVLLAVCEQQWRRPACASAQSDQRPCYIRFLESIMASILRRKIQYHKTISCMRTTKAQTSLRIRAVWSAHLLFAFWKVVWIIASLSSWTDSFDYYFHGYPEDRFSRLNANYRLKCTIKWCQPPPLYFSPYLVAVPYLARPFGLQHTGP